jgi:NAD(P)-dependent dehydrogenase (short-subunit alcohol dehydrogenase family)
VLDSLLIAIDGVVLEVLQKMPNPTALISIDRLLLYIRGLIEILLNIQENICGLISTKSLSTPRGKNWEGRLALITGGNAGVGFGIAQELVRCGCSVILCCRSLNKAEQAAEALHACEPYDGCIKGSVSILPLDLSSFASVKVLVNSLVSKGNPIDLLICNAGVMAIPERTETDDGFELTWQVNYLSHALLVLDTLRGLRSACERTGVEPRVVMLSSLTHWGAKLNLDTTSAHLEEPYDSFLQYANSKLCMLLFAKELHRRMTGRRDGLPFGCAVAAHPGVVNTALARDFFNNDMIPNLARPILAPVLEKYVYPLVFRSVPTAAKHVMYACTELSDTVGGCYCVDGLVVRSSDASHDTLLSAKLWDLTAKLIM